MIQLLPCNKCEKTLVLPKGVSEEATIECPKCNAEFLLKDLVDAQIGYWKVISDPGELRLAPADPDFREMRRPSLRHSVAGQVPPRPQSPPPSHGASTQPVEREDPDEELRISEPIPRPPSKKKFKPVEPITHEQFERMKRKDRSPIWTMLQMALGALAAIPIAMILIWHLVGKDIGGAGPFVAKYAPWLVPEEFHGNSKDDEESDENSESEDIDPDDPPPAPGESGFRQYSEAEISGSGTTQEDWESAGVIGSEDSGSESDEPEPEEQTVASGNERGVQLSASESGSSTPKTTPSQPDSTLGPKSDSESSSTEDDAQSDAPESNESDALNSSNAGTADRNEDADLPSTKERQTSENALASSPSGADRKRSNIDSKIQSCVKAIQSLSAEGSVDEEPVEETLESLADLGSELAKLPAGSPFFGGVREKMDAVGSVVANSKAAQTALSESLADWISERENKSPATTAAFFTVDRFTSEDKSWIVEPSGEELDWNISKAIIPKSLAKNLEKGQSHFSIGTLESNDEAPNTWTFTAYYLHSME